MEKDTSNASWKARAASGRRDPGNPAMADPVGDRLDRFNLEPFLVSLQGPEKWKFVAISGIFWLFSISPPRFVAQ